MNKYICYNLKQHSGVNHSWDFFPANFWKSLLSAFQEIGINEIGFEFIVSKDDLISIWLKENLNPLNLLSFTPFHGQSETEILTFNLCQKVYQFLRTETDIYDFNVLNEFYPYDEIVFFKDAELKSIIVPYESLVFLYNFSQEDYQTLSRFIKGVNEHLHYM